MEVQWQWDWEWRFTKSEMVLRRAPRNWIHRKLLSHIASPLHTASFLHAASPLQAASLLPAQSLVRGGYLIKEEKGNPNSEERWKLRKFMATFTAVGSRNKKDAEKIKGRPTRWLRCLNVLNYKVVWLQREHITHCSGIETTGWVLPMTCLPLTLTLTTATATATATHVAQRPRKHKRVAALNTTRKKKTDTENSLDVCMEFTPGGVTLSQG